MTVGRFLEVSVSAPEIGTSVLFYEGLGFRQLDTGETWSHPYAVMSDGSVHIGLHAYEFASPSLTFVHPQLAGTVDDLLAHGIQLAFSKLGDDEFNELGFLAPARQMVTLLEARTFSPPAFDDRAFTLCGRFSAFAVPVAEVEWATAFWQRLGFDAPDGEADDAADPVVTLQGDGIAVACCPSAVLRQPALRFAVEDLEQCAAALRSKGFEPDEFAEVPGGTGITLKTPEGLTLQLVLAAP
ncbi:MAG: hypothetical protein AAGD86_00960 [Pseudomonadota bacterium]